MRNYQPIDVGVEIDCILSDLYSINWTPLGAVLEFFIPDSDEVLKIAFVGMVVVRVLDELHISTEDDPKDRHGMIAHHFAYKVTGHAFKGIQSELLRDDGLHYQFITGNGCADVISQHPPSITIRRFSKREQAELGG